MPAEELALEDKFSLNRVMVSKINILPQGRILHFEFRRLGNICRCAGNSRKYGIAERCHLTVRTAKRLHLTVGDAPDPQGPLTFFNLEGNGRALHGNHFANQLYEVRDRAALFAGINA